MRMRACERKMLAMGRVLMVEPAVFLLDEPTANLAPQVAAELLTGHLRALAEAGAAVLIVEQRPGLCWPSSTTPTCSAAGRC